MVVLISFDMSLGNTNCPLLNTCDVVQSKKDKWMQLTAIRLRHFSAVKSAQGISAQVKLRAEFKNELTFCCLSSALIK